MRKKLALFFSLVLCVCALGAQVSSDPSHEFYTLAQSWELRGIVAKLPPLRPYPVAVIKDILSQVMQGGSERDTEAASRIWEEVTGKPWSAELEILANGATFNDSGAFMLTAIPRVTGDLSLFHDFVSFGYKLGFVGRTQKNYMDFNPLFTNYAYDAIQDPATIGPMFLYLDTDDSIAVGNTRLFAQAGVNRTGYGQFLDDGLCLNDTAYHAANFSLTYSARRFSYAQQISALGATSSYDGRLGTLLPNKFLAFHVLEFKVSRIFSFSYYENIVYGNRFEPSYLIPAPYMAVQGLGGNNDNLQMGITASVRPMDGFLWATDIFVDDIDVNGLVKFNWDTRIRIAARTGLIYTPANSFCSRVSLDYTIVTPYTYSHWEYDNWDTMSMSAGTRNYQNYTNNGISMGASIPPNSDSFKFSVDFRPAPRLSLGVSTMFVRHANVSESLTDDEALFYLSSDEGVYATDGSVYEATAVAGGRQTYTSQNHLNFMTQAHKMYVFQGSVTGEYSLPRFKWGRLSFKGGFTFEYVRNKGVDKHMYPGGPVEKDKKSDPDNPSYIYNGKTYSTPDEKAELAKLFKDKWAEGLSDSVDCYMYAGICYRF